MHISVSYSRGTSLQLLIMKSCILQEFSRIFYPLIYWDNLIVRLAAMFKTFVESYVDNVLCNISSLAFAITNAADK